MKILPALVFAPFQLARALSVQASGQTNDQQFASASINTFAVSQEDVSDEIGNEDSAYRRWLSFGKIMPKMLSCLIQLTLATFMCRWRTDLGNFIRCGGVEHEYQSKFCDRTGRA